MNQVENIRDLLSGNFTGVFDNIEQHMQGALAAPFGADMNLLQQSDGFLDECFLENAPYCQDVSSIFGHQELFQAMSSGDGNSVRDFTASPISGLLLGVPGPVLGVGGLFSSDAALPDPGGRCSTRSVST